MAADTEKEARNMEDKALVYLEDVTLCMEENIVLRNVSLTLHNGEFVYVIGKVGSGRAVC